jgi:hypothetical protein
LFGQTLDITTSGDELWCLSFSKSLEQIDCEQRPADLTKESCLVSGSTATMTNISEVCETQQAMQISRKLAKIG